MSLFRFTRTSQPQQAVAIDWNNPNTKNLFFACDRFGQNYAGRINHLGFSGTRTDRATPKGVGRGGGGTGYFTGPAERSLVAPTDAAFSIVGTFALGATGQTNKYLAYDYRDVTSQAAVIFGYVANTLEFYCDSFTGTNPRTGSGIVVNDTLPHTFGYSYDGTNWIGYLDGVRVFSTTRTFSCNMPTGAFTTSLLSAGGGNTLNASILQWTTFDKGIGEERLKSLTANPWQIWLPTNRAIYPETDVSPDITLALTGQSAGAVEQGSVAPVITVPLTGVATAVAQGGLTVAGSPDITLPLTGLATVADQGSLLASATVPLTGQAAVAARGTLAPETSKDLTGQAVALAQGAVLPQTSVALTGQAVVAAQGVLVAPGDVTVALTGQGVSLVTGLMVGSVTPDPGNGKSGVNRMWLIEYYTKEFAKKEAAQAVALEGLTATAKRKAVKKATIAREAAVEKLVAKAESDLEVLTQGIADIGAAQKFTQALIQQVVRQPEPEIDFMQVANDYRKRMRQEDDELLLFAMVI